MQKIDLEIEDTFYLGKVEYKYKYKEQDKLYYIREILKIDFEKDNIKENLLRIFTSILKPQNYHTKLSEPDVFGLLNYFNAKYFG